MKLTIFAIFIPFDIKLFPASVFILLYDNNNANDGARHDIQLDYCFD